MKQHFIKKGTSDRLLLIFTGWASDERLFSMFSDAKQDVCVCSDYQTLEWNVQLFQSYKEIEVIAWSLGVFVANKILLDSDLPIVKAVAINGTLYPCDDEKGIPKTIYNGTEESLTEENLLKFYRRMCKNKEDYKNFLIHKFSFPITELQEALQNIRTTFVETLRATSLPETTIFTEVIIGLSDRIFPAKNQQQAWENFPNIKLEEIAHYDEKIWRKYVDDKAIGS